MLVKSRLVITLIVLLITLIAATAKAQASQNVQIILNLLIGQQYFGVPHIYQGSPIYYGPSNASLYWAEGNLSNDQPVLQLVSIGSWYPGVMFWNGYFDGGNITVSMIGTYSSGGIRLADGSSYPSGGFVIYLFLNPTTWNISPQFNYTIMMIAPESPVGDTILLPHSSIPYLIIQWEPFWEFGYTQSGATGQWNVWIVNNTNGVLSVTPSPSPNLGSGWAGWIGIGTGAFRPNPGDLINITVTYDPSTNALTGIAYDMNTGQSANFTLNLGNYFTPPSSGNYVFGVGAAIISPIVHGKRYNHTGIGHPSPFYSSNNWALLYTAVSMQLAPPPVPPTVSSLTVHVFNVLSRPATTVPGVVFGVLYNSSFSEVAYMNSSGYLNFINLTPGTYTLEVYHYPNLGLNLTEYWGGMTVSLNPGNNFVTFYRHEPWIYDLQAVGNGTRLTINVTVNNPLNATLHGKLYIWVTTSPQTANPSEPTIDTSATSITIGPGPNKFTYYYATTQDGSYYIYTALLIYNRTQLITTDQWNWTAMYQLEFVIISRAPTVSFKLYKSNNYFHQVQEIASIEISDVLQTIIFSLSQGIYKYELSLSNQDYTIEPSSTGFINLTKNQNIRLFVTQTSNPPLVNLIPVGLPDPLQWYVTYQSPLASLIFLPDRDGAIRLNVFSFFRTGTYIVNLNVYSTNPQYYPLLPTIQLNATYLSFYPSFSNVIYAVPFAMAGYPAHIVKRNGVQWNPLLNEYYQHNPRYAYSRYITIPYTNINIMKVYEHQDGFCWGMSSTAILYYLGYLPLPSQGVRYTSQLYFGPINAASGYLEYLTDASLAVAVHQVFDPDNNALISEISKVIYSSFCNSNKQSSACFRDSANEIASKAISYIDNNEPVILIIRFTNQSGNSLYVGSGYHAVVVWGYVKEPNGKIVFLVYDPNYPQIITRAIHDSTSFIYIDGGPPYSVNVNGQIFSYPGDIGEVIGVASPQPAKLQWFNPNQWLLDLALCSLYPSLCWLWWLNQQRVQILQSGLLDYTLYVSTKPLNVFLGGELAGYFVDKYFVTASKVSPGKLAGYVDGNPSSRLYIVAVRNDVAARVDPDSTLVAIRFANASGNVMVYGFVANSTGLVAVRFVNQSSFIMTSPSSTVVKLELFSATNSSVKTYNTTLELNSGTGYVVNANFTNLTNVIIKTVTVNWANIAPTQTTTTTTTSTAATTATTTSITTTATTATTATQTVQPSVQTATAATSTSGVQPPPLVVVPTPQSTAAANGQTRQIGALQIATWALVGVAAFLLAYLLSRSLLSRKP